MEHNNRQHKIKCSSWFHVYLRIPNAEPRSLAILETQKLVVQKWLDDNNRKMHKLYVDVTPMSTPYDKRPQLQELLKQRLTNDAILTFSWFSILTSNHSESTQLIGNLVKVKCHLIFANYDIFDILSSPGKMVTELFLECFNFISTKSEYDLIGNEEETIFKHENSKFIAENQEDRNENKE